MKITAPFLSLLFPLFLLGCGVEAPRPALTPPPPTPRPPLSNLAVTLSIPQSQIAQFLNAKDGQQLADIRDQDVKCPFGHCRMNLTAFRNGPADISTANGQLAVRLPFRLSVGVKTSGFLSSLGPAQGDAEGVANATTALTIGPDWRLRSQLTGHIDLSNAHLRIGPLTTNVAQLWDQGGEGLEKPIWRLLDNQIARVNLKPQIEALWTRAFVPVMVSKTPLSWLVLTPESLGLMQPELAHGALTLSLALAARGQVVVQDAMPINPATPLPSAVPLQQAYDRFSISLSFLLPYSQAEKFAMASLARNPPRVNGMTLSFSSVHIMPSGQDVVVETRFCGAPNWDFTDWFASCAHVYLRGRPAFDPATRTVRIDGLHYDVASADAMLHVLTLLASQKISNFIGKTLVFDVSHQLGHEEDQIRAELAQPHGKTLSLSGSVQSFGTPSFFWTRDGFLAFFSATGSVRAIFNP
jgi:Domain of unknown function (DUF4403)